MSRIITIIAALVVIIGTITWGVMSRNSDTAGDSANGTTNSKLVEIKGLITSEKESLFRDPEFIAALEAEGLKVSVERWTSAKIADTKDVAAFGEFSDFVFPSGVQTSDKVRKNIPKAQLYNVFYSPMIVASWKPIVQILETKGLVKDRGDHKILDMEKFYDLSAKRVKWKDMPGADTLYPVNKNVLIYTSDVKTSNASKMYLGLASYIYNGSDVVQTPEQVSKVAPRLKQIMSAQGHRELSSTNLFADYTSIGMGKTPMVFLYESELIEYAVKNSGLAPDMAILYTSPTIYTKHAIVAFNPKTQALVNALQNNPKIKTIAARYGFRFSGNNTLPEFAKTYKINLAQNLVDVIDPPSFDMLEEIITQTENLQ